MQSIKPDDELSLDEKWERYFFERDRDIKHLQSRGFYLDAGDDPAMIEPVKLEHDVVKLALRKRNNMIANRLNQLGPGWAVGVRLKQQPYPVRQQHAQQPTLDMEWEVHEMALIDGKLVEALIGFEYFTLPAQTGGLSGVGTEKAQESD